MPQTRLLPLMKLPFDHTEAQSSQQLNLECTVCENRSESHTERVLQYQVSLVDFQGVFFSRTVAVREANPLLLHPLSYCHGASKERSSNSGRSKGFPSGGLAGCSTGR